MEEEVRDCRATLRVTANEDAKVFRQEPQVTLIKLIMSSRRVPFSNTSELNIQNDRMP